MREVLAGSHQLQDARRSAVGDIKAAPRVQRNALRIGQLRAGGLTAVTRIAAASIAGNGTPGYSGDGHAATSAQLNSPYGVAADAGGDLFIADAGNLRVRKVTAGGTISTVPFQQWRYRHIDGIGDNVIIEFVDPTRSGEFHMTMDPSEKDSMRPDVRVVQLRRDTGTQILVIITLDASAAFHIFGEVTTPAGLIVQSFESDSSGQKEFTKLLPLQAGNYRLVVAMKNLTTGLAGRRELTLTVQ